MRTPFLVCSLFFTLLCISCGSDDDAINNSIVGTWKLSSSNTGEGTPVSLLDCEKNTTYTFTNDTFSRKNFEANIEKTDCLPVQESSTKYKANGNKIEFLDASGNVVVSNESQFTFSVGGDKLTIIDTNPSTGKPVLELFFDRK